MLLAPAGSLGAPDSDSPALERSRANDHQVRAWSKDAVIYEVNVRQYTEEGTFEAFAEHLPRLEELGVDILWFMPIHPIGEENRKGTLGSYYSVRDYRGVNPEFGTKEDFGDLVEQAKDRGFKVMMDFVPNHTAWDHPWVAENPDWYMQDEAGEIVHPPGTDWTDVAQVDWDNRELRAALIDAMRYWVREFDIDGYRVDFVGGVPDDFSRQARKALDRIKPVFMLAEDEQKTHLLKRDYHANYAWWLFHTMTQVAGGEASAGDVREYVDWMQDTYPKGGYPMTFTSNHDENSWNGTTRELFGEAEHTMAVLTFALPGMPLIYSGQEAGLDHRLEFFEKDEISWDDLSMQDFYEQLVDLKKGNEALWNGIDGGPAEFLPASDPDTLAFQREKGDNRVVVVMNLSGEASSSTVRAADAAGYYEDYFAGEPFQLGAEHSFELDAWEYRVLVR
ncbi:alpha-amylase [Haloechinothrix sp. LS1_15]|nr:alpha-amylase [Haloechinothrix sp. LS1_15]